MFIAEAPGRAGADRTGIPLHGDATGINFETLLAHAGFDRHSTDPAKRIFVTNAVLCNPRDEKGNNGTPNEEELRNCSFHLQMQMDLVRPKVLVTLGAKALEALALIRFHELKLSRDVASLQWWNGRRLFPLYHPSPRALMSRNLTRQKQDYVELARLLEIVNYAG
jgi:uracil-DNA glycosylase family 4